MDIERFAAAIAKPGDTVFLEATRALSDEQRNRLLELCQRVDALTHVHVVLLDVDVRVARMAVTE